jgi:immune inhibitor A
MRTIKSNNNRSVVTPAVTRRAASLGLASALALAPQYTYAVPAAPIDLEATQPNGDKITIRQTGDENSHQIEDSQGYTIGYNEKSKRWHYLVQDADGSLKDSNVPVRGIPKKADADLELPDTSPEGLPKDHQKHLRPAKSEKRIRHDDSPQVSGPQRSAGTVTLSSLTGTSTLASTPATVSVNVPVILINFSNTTTTNTPAQFNTLLFGTGATDYSMKQYYEEASYGQFTVSPGTNGIAGWFKAPQTHDYYGTNNSSLGNLDSHAGLLVYQAAQAADPTFDFSQYDANGDCYVDNVMVVHQGKGEEASAMTTDIWSHSWDLSSARYYDPTIPSPYYTTNDICAAQPTQTVKVMRYTIQPERYGTGISTMGVFAHEFGHVLGLPDLYDTDNSSYGIGKWSIMSYGSWNGVSRAGDRPAHFDAWSKFALGWTTPFQLTGSLTGLTLSPAYSSGDVLQVVRGSSPSEYYLFENRKKAGFDAALPGGGLLVWHVDETVVNNNNQCYPGGPNCATRHYKVALVQADNLWYLEKKFNQGDGGDVFPGTSNRISFSGSTSPNSKWFDSTVSNIGISNIVVNSDGTLTADFSAP